MASLSVTDIQEINYNKKKATILLLILLFSLLALVIILIRSLDFTFTFLELYFNALSGRPFNLSNSSETSNIASIFISMSAFLTSFCAVIVSALFPCYEWIKKSDEKLNDDKLKKIEDENKRIEDSISLFYIPLQNLLTVYDKRESEEGKIKLINEIIGHKHLAESVEPSVIPLLEKYVKTNEAVSGKLLKLVERDIENLQNRFSKLKET